MAPASGKLAKAEALWRQAWVGCPHIGVVELGKDAAGQEQLIIKSKTVFREHSAEAEVLDDGRTVGVGIGDTVCFGIVERKGRAPIAVNIFRTTGTKKKKRRRTEEEEAVDDADDLPPDLVGELPGLVRIGRLGDYLVSSWKVFDAYQKPAVIRKADLPEGIKPGDPVYFKVRPPQDGNPTPTAMAIRKAPHTVRKEEEAKSRERGKGFGKGFNGEGGSRPRRRPTGATMRMNGIVKRPSETTGRYFIFCQDISDVYHKDAQVPVEEVPPGGLTPGDRIAFDVDEPDENRPDETPWAFNVKIIGSARGKRKAAVADIGDGEEEGDGEDIEENADAEADVEEKPEPALGEEERQEAEANEDLDAQLARLAEEEDASRKPVRPKPKRRAALVPSREEASDREAAEPPEEEPDSTEGWVAAQDRLFPGLPKLPKGWIRIRSKSRGLVYFYNVDTGESTPHEPKA